MPADVEDADQRRAGSAAVVIGMPWSCAAGMKWVPIRPLVVAPQIAKLAGEQPERPGPGGAEQRRSGDRRAAARRAAPAAARGRRRSRRRPAARGRAGGRACSNSTSGTTASAASGDGQRRRPPAVVVGQRGDHRQEDQLAGRAGRGEDAADQAAARDEPAVADGRDERHRHRAGADPDQHAPAAAAAASSAVMNTVSPLPAATSSSATQTTGRMPNRSISAAANGDIRPNSIMLIDIAEPMVRVRPAELHVQRVHEHARAPRGTPPRRASSRRSPRRPARPGAAASRAHRRLRRRFGDRPARRDRAGNAHRVILRDRRPDAPVAGLPICARILP